MENTQHSDLLHLHPNGARSFCFDALGIVPRLARLLRILWKHEGGYQVAEHRADETGAPHACDSRLRTNHALKTATEDVRSGWFRSRPRTFLLSATSANGPSSACGRSSGGSPDAPGGAP